MRIILVNLLAACCSLSILVAGQLDLAVVQFPEEKTVADLEIAVANVDLFEMTGADRTRTSHPYLKGGSVLFAQRLSLSPSSTFMTVTRLRNASAHVDGYLRAGKVSVSISLIEGVKAGLRTFQKKSYSGAGALPPGAAHVLGLRQFKGQSATVIKGQAKMESYLLTTVVMAQYHP